LASKSLNISLKSELMNIESFHRGRVNDQFPGRLKPGRGRLRLPERNVERPIQVFQTAEMFGNINGHQYVSSSR